MDAAGRPRSRYGRHDPAFWQSVHRGSTHPGVLRLADGHRVSGLWLWPGRARTEYVHRRLLSTARGQGDPHAQCAAWSRHRPRTDLRADLREPWVLVGVAGVSRCADSRPRALCGTLAFAGGRLCLLEPRNHSDHSHDPAPVLDLCRLRVGLRDLRNDERQLGEHLSFLRPRGFFGDGGVGSDGVLGERDRRSLAVCRRGTGGVRPRGFTGCCRSSSPWPLSRWPPRHAGTVFWRWCVLASPDWAVRRSCHWSSVSRKRS